MILVVTYDLNKLKDYPRVYKAIGDLGATIRDPGLDSVWFVDTRYTFEQAKDNVIRSIDQDDRVFISKLHSGEYAGWLVQDVWNWLYSRI